MKVQRPASSARRGFVLLAVLVFILLLSMVTVSLLFRSRAEETAASASRGGEQAWAAAFSGIQQVLRMAAAAKSGKGDWSDNPAAFRERMVFEDGSERWQFTVFSPGDSESLTEVRYGLTDEASRINLNHPGGCDLAKIPRLTEEKVQSLRAVIGGTNGAGPGLSSGESSGTPADTSTSAQPVTQFGDSRSVLGSAGVRPGGSFATVEALLRLPGFSPELLFGEDVNRNGRLDPNENDGDETLPTDNRDGRLDHGMAQYLTTTAYDLDLTRGGQRRVDLNDPQAALPSTDLPPAFTNYVANLRAAGLRLAHPVEVLEATFRVKDEEGNETEITSGITKEELPLVLDLFTTGSETRREGLINVNTASAIVLATLPGMDLSLAETVVSARPGLRPEVRATPAWLLTEGLVEAPLFRRIAPFLTAHSYQFSFHVIGYGLPSGQYRVFQVEVDGAGETPIITQIRDLTRLGLPFNLLSETLDQTTPGTASLRAIQTSLPKRKHG